MQHDSRNAHPNPRFHAEPWARRAVSARAGQDTIDRGTVRSWHRPAMPPIALAGHARAKPQACHTCARLFSDATRRNQDAAHARPERHSCHPSGACEAACVIVRTCALAKAKSTDGGEEPRHQWHGNRTSVPRTRWTGLQCHAREFSDEGVTRRLRNPTSPSNPAMPASPGSGTVSTNPPPLSSGKPPVPINVRPSADTPEI